MTTLDILRETFGLVGAASVAAWTAAAILLGVGLFSPARWTAWLWGLAAAAAGVGLAAVTSESIRSFEVDRSAAVAAAEAAGAEKAQSRLRTRAADIRFAEDTAADQADVAGVSVAEEQGAYERAVEEELAKIPAYRSRGKKVRSGRQAGGDAAGSAGDDATADDEAAAGGPEGSDPRAADNPPPVRSLPAAALLVADRFDRANRAVAWGLLSLTAGLCCFEYVRRYNTTTDAVWPVPLAGTFIDGLAVKEHRGLLPADRLPEFLEQAVRKGESFIAFVENDPLPDRDVVDRIALGPLGWRLPKRSFSAAALADDPGLLETVFETAWFGRGCFVITGAEGAADALTAMATECGRRTRTRANARCTVNLVWALPVEPPPTAGEELERLAARVNLRWLRLA